MSALRRFLIDTDTGSDDAWAIVEALCAASVARVEAITTVCGNFPLDLCTKNALLAEDAVGIIQATGRVAVRQGMEGKRLFWVHPGDTVEVLAVTDDWVLIEGGMIRRSYVEIEGEAE